MNRETAIFILGISDNTTLRDAKTARNHKIIEDKDNHKQYNEAFKVFSNTMDEYLAPPTAFIADSNTITPPFTVNNYPFDEPEVLRRIKALPDSAAFMCTVTKSPFTMGMKFDALKNTMHVFDPVPGKLAPFYHEIELPVNYRELGRKSVRLGDIDDVYSKSTPDKGLLEVYKDYCRGTVLLHSKYILRKIPRGFNLSKAMTGEIIVKVDPEDNRPGTDPGDNRRNSKGFGHDAFCPLCGSTSITDICSACGGYMCGHLTSWPSSWPVDLENAHREPCPYCKVEGWFFHPDFKYSGTRTKVTSSSNTTMYFRKSNGAIGQDRQEKLTTQTPPKRIEKK